MSEWKKVKIDFDTIKLGDFIEPIKTTVLELGEKNPIVYGVTNKEGIVQTGKPASKDISNYIVLEDDCFVFNPYRVNVGSIGINDKNLKGCVSPAYVVFKTKNGLLPKFLYFYLKSDYGIHLINWYGNRGGVRNALRYSDLCNIDIPNINNLDQQRILERFLSASAKIDEIRKEIESQKNYIKQLRQNILQEAIEGKLTADWRKQNPSQKGNPDYDAEALFEQIQKERNSEKKQKESSPITDEEKPFEIPEGWKWVRLGSIIQYLSDFNSNGGYALLDSSVKMYDTKDYAIMIRTTDFENDFDLAKVKYINEKAYNLLEKSKLFGNEIIMNKIGSAGKTFIMPKLNYPASLGRNAFLIRLTTRCEVKFIYDVLNSDFGKNDIQQYVKGALTKTITKDNVRRLLIPFPPLLEQKEIVTRVEKHLQTVFDLENQVSSREDFVKQLMQSILKDAFEGK